jgi:hypothetical protein
MHLAKITRMQEHQKRIESLINEQDLKKAIDLKKQIQNKTARREAYEKVR